MKNGDHDRKELKARLREKIDWLRPWWTEACREAIVREVLRQLRGKKIPAKDLDEATQGLLIDELCKRREDDAACLLPQFERRMAWLLPSWQKELQEDLGQKATMQVLAYVERQGYRCEISGGFLSTTAKNTLLDHVRQQKDEVSIDDLAHDPPKSTEPGPEAEARRVELGEAIRQCLDALTPDERRATELSILDEDMKPREIAAILGVVPKQLDNWLNRARKKLRDCLEARGYHRSSRRKGRS